MLLAVVVALLVFAFRPEPDLPVWLPEPETAQTPTLDPDKTPVSPEPPALLESEGLSVREVRVTESPGGRIVETTLSGRAPGGADLALDESNVSATTDAGDLVSRFFEPFLEPPSLLASEDTLATLRWWLESPADTIWLQVQGRRIRADLP